MTKTNVPRLRFREFDGEWKEDKINSISSNTRGSGLPKENINENKKGNPVIHYADIYKFNNVMNKVIHWSTNNDGVKVPDNSVVFPMSDVTPNGLAKCSFVNVDNVKAGSDILIFSMNYDKSGKFVSYFVSGNKNKFLRLVTGTSVKHINAKSIGNVKIFNPKLCEQKKIGSFFEKIDKLIELQTQKLEQLKKLKRGYLQKMFPQDGESLPRLRFSGFSGKWKEGKLGDLYPVNTGKSTYNSFENGKYPIAGSTGIIGCDNEFDYEGNFLLIARVGDAGSTYCNSGKMKITDNTIFIDAEYEEFLSGVLRNKNIKRLSVGSGRKLIKSSDLKKISVTIPEKNEQSKINNFLREFNKKIEAQSKKIEALKQQKKAYLQKMFI